MKCCAFCYKPQETLSKCGKCQKRQFCSRDCQRLDWKAGHKHWCGMAGEVGVDFVVRDAGSGKGLGVFALRSFHRNDKIMAERPVLLFPSAKEVPEQAKEAVSALLPLNGSLSQKVARNGMACDDASITNGLFVTMSRVNHDCYGNTDHYYSERLKVKILVANREIERGEEVTFSYVPNKKSAARKGILLAVYGFDCTCSVCTDETKEVETAFERAKELDDSIMTLVGLGKIDPAVRKGKALVAIYDKYDMSSWLYHRTYYDLFQVTIAKRQRQKEAEQFIQKAFQAVLDYTGDADDDVVQRMQIFVTSPTSHRNFAALG